MNTYTAHIERADGTQTSKSIEAPGIRSAYAHAKALLRDDETLRGVTEDEES